MSGRQPQAQVGTKEGWLAKTGSNNKGWKDRYFILSNGKLSYFKSEKDDTPLGHVDLKEVNEVTMATGKKGGYGFDMTVSSGRIYNFSTKTDMEQAEWMSAVQCAVESIQKIHGPPPSPSSFRKSSGSISISSRKSTSGSISSISGSILGRKKVTTRKDSDSSLDDSLQRSTSPSTNQGGGVGVSGNDKKSDVVNSLLEAEVDALRNKLTRLESELETAASQRKVSQFKLEETKESYEDTIRQLNDEIIAQKEKILSLEDTKTRLETVNDNLTEQVQYKEDTITNLQQSVDDLKDLEEEIKHWQEEASAAKEGLEEIEEEQKDLRNSLSDARHNEEELQKQLTQLTSKLEMTEKERDRLKAAINFQSQKIEKTPVNESELKEEKLQLQLEIENLKQSKSKEIEKVEESFKVERQSLLGQLEESRSLNTQTINELNAVKKELKEALLKINELNETVKSTEERRKQLQVEKDKLVSDLITMRKSMKEKVSSFEEDTCSSPKTSKQKEGNGSPTLAAKLAEAEGRAEMATRLLQEIQSERDALKQQLGSRRSVSPSPQHVNNRNDIDSPAAGGSGNNQLLLTPPPPFIVKSQPSMSVSRPDIAPPKPKRPPKDLVQQLLLSSS